MKCDPYKGLSQEKLQFEEDKEYRNPREGELDLPNA